MADSRNALCVHIGTFLHRACQCGCHVPGTLRSGLLGHAQALKTAPDCIRDTYYTVTLLPWVPRPPQRLVCSAQVSPPNTVPGYTSLCSRVAEASVPWVVATVPALLFFPLLPPSLSHLSLSLLPLFRINSSPHPPPFLCHLFIHAISRILYSTRLSISLVHKSLPVLPISPTQSHSPPAQTASVHPNRQRATKKN